MMILAVSDFSPDGSGYQRIMTNLCTRLATDYDKHIVALGLGYNGQEHANPFAIVPANNVKSIPDMIYYLRQRNTPIEAVFVGLDIPLQKSFLDEMKLDGAIPYIGLFPLEAPPLCQPWAIELLRMDSRLVMSEFGRKEFERAGCDAEFLPLGVDDIWRPPSPEEREMLREGLGIDKDTFVVLTVADNQERKNLSKAAEIISRLSIDIEGYLPNGFAGKKTVKRAVAWYVVTRLKSPAGWELQDLAMRWGIMDRMNLFNRGVPDDKLWILYAVADCFLLTSKAEGLAIPIMEAMACRVPVAGTDCTAIREHLDDGRGWLIPYEYEYTDPFGNGQRYFIDAEAGASILAGIMDALEVQKRPTLDRAQEYVKARSWENATRILVDVLDRQIEEKGTGARDGETEKETPVTTEPV